MCTRNYLCPPLGSVLWYIPDDSILKSFSIDISRASVYLGKLDGGRIVGWLVISKRQCIKWMKLYREGTSTADSGKGYGKRNLQTPLQDMKFLLRYNKETIIVRLEYAFDLPCPIPPLCKLFYDTTFQILDTKGHDLTMSIYFSHSDRTSLSTEQYFDDFQNPDLMSYDSNLIKRYILFLSEVNNK